MNRRELLGPEVRRLGPGWVHALRTGAIRVHGSAGLREGELKGKRDTLLRLLARAGIALTADESARIHACTDNATLDRWRDNVLGAKTATDVLS